METAFSFSDYLLGFLEKLQQWSVSLLRQKLHQVVALMEVAWRTLLAKKTFIESLVRVLTIRSKNLQ